MFNISIFIAKMKKRYNLSFKQITRSERSDLSSRSPSRYSHDRSRSPMSNYRNCSKNHRERSRHQTRERSRDRSKHQTRDRFRHQTRSRFRTLSRSPNDRRSLEDRGQSVIRSNIFF